jgi:hypothetical protein
VSLGGGIKHRSSTHVRLLQRRLLLVSYKRREVITLARFIVALAHKRRVEEVMEGGGWDQGQEDFQTS